MAQRRCMSTSKLRPEFDFDFLLYGIISNNPEYKIAWKINQEMNILLKKRKDIEIEFTNNKFICISNFRFETENTTFELLKNKSNLQATAGIDFLLPELKQIDFLLKINGSQVKNDSEELLEALKRVHGVLNLIKIKVSRLKFKDNLIY